MNSQDLEKLIASKKAESKIYVFSGPEVFLKNKMLQMFVKHYIPEEDAADNVFKIICSAKDLSDSFNQLNSFTFNSSPRIFYFQDIDSVPAKNRKTFLQSILDCGIPENTFVIFTSSDSKIATEVASKFKKQCEKVDFWAPFANKLPQWVSRTCAEYGSEMSSEASDLLIELAGSDLSLLDQEIKKLAIAYPGKRIGAREVQKAVAYVRNDTIFDLLNAFGTKNPQKIVRLIETLIGNGETPQKIWYMVCRQIRDFRIFNDLCADRPDLFNKIKNLISRYGSLTSKSDYKSNMEKKEIISSIQAEAENIPTELASAAGLTSQNKIKNLYMALNFDRTRLIKMWPDILKTDLEMKSGGNCKVLLTSFMLRAIAKDASLGKSLY